MNTEPQHFSAVVPVVLVVIVVLDVLVVGVVAVEDVLVVGVVEVEVVFVVVVVVIVPHTHPQSPWAIWLRSTVSACAIVVTHPVPPKACQVTPLSLVYLT